MFFLLPNLWILRSSNHLAKVNTNQPACNNGSISPLFQKAQLNLDRFHCNIVYPIICYLNFKLVQVYETLRYYEICGGALGISWILECLWSPSPLRAFSLLADGEWLPDSCQGMPCSHTHIIWYFKSMPVGSIELLDFCRGSRTKWRLRPGMSNFE